MYIKVYPINQNLNTINCSSLFDLFLYSDIKLFVLTNGIDYWFYSKYDLGIDDDNESVPYSKLNLLNVDDYDKLEDYSKENLLNNNLNYYLKEDKLRKSVDDFFENYNSLSDKFLNVFKEYYNLNSFDVSNEELREKLSSYLDNNYKNIYELLCDNVKVDKDYLSNVYIDDKGCVVTGSSDLFKKFIIKVIDKDYNNLDKLLNLDDIWTKSLYIKKGNISNETDKRNKSYYKPYNLIFMHHSNTPEIMKKIVDIIDRLNLDYDFLKFKIK